jgi:hypothetical protein
MTSYPSRIPSGQIKRAFVKIIVANAQRRTANVQSRPLEDVTGFPRDARTLRFHPVAIATFVTLKSKGFPIPWSALRGGLALKR